MSNREIWGMTSKDFHELIGEVEIGVGLSILVASAYLISSGVGCLGGVFGGLAGLKLIVNGGKELIDTRTNPKYRE